MLTIIFIICSIEAGVARIELPLRTPAPLFTYVEIDQLPDGAAEGDVLTLASENFLASDIWTDLVIDKQRTEQRRDKITTKLNQLRDYGFRRNSRTTSQGDTK